MLPTGGAANGELSAASSVSVLDLRCDRLVYPGGAAVHPMSLRGPETSSDAAGDVADESVPDEPDARDVGMGQGGARSFPSARPPCRPMLFQYGDGDDAGGHGDTAEDGGHGQETSHGGFPLLSDRRATETLGWAVVWPNTAAPDAVPTPWSRAVTTWRAFATRLFYRTVQRRARLRLPGRAVRAEDVPRHRGRYPAPGTRPTALGPHLRTALPRGPGECTLRKRAAWWFRRLVRRLSPFPVVMVPPDSLRSGAPRWLA